MGKLADTKGNLLKRKFRFLFAFIMILLLLTPLLIIINPPIATMNAQAPDLEGEEDEGNTTAQPRNKDRTASEKIDSDNDGIDDDQERERGTDPTNSDTDDDGVPDGEDKYPLDSARWRSSLDIYSQLTFEILIIISLLLFVVIYYSLLKRKNY